MPEQAPTTNGTAAYPELDIAKLHALPSEQQDLSLLTFTSELARHVSKLDADGATSQQVYIKKELFKVINLSAPLPSRVTRHNLGKSFAVVFGKGDRKLLIESINELLSLLNSGSGKTDKDLKTKQTAAHCLGAIFEAAGDSATSYAPTVSGTLLRLLKPAQAHTGLRGTIFRAIGKIFKGVQKFADEQPLRDAFKQARSAVSGEKSFFVQASACSCLEQLYRSNALLDNSSDFEKLQKALWKAFDSPSSHVRHAAASCLSAVLVKSYSENPNPTTVPKVKKPKKKKNTDLDGDEEVERPDSPAPTKDVTHLSFSLSDALRQLSTVYCKPTTSNRARAGIATCYTKFLKELGASTVDSKYGEIALHLFNDLLSFPSIYYTRHRLLITRKYVSLILEEVIGNQLLGETGQLNAAKFLITSVLKDYPQALKERPEPSKQALIGSLSALSTLLRSLGAASNAIAESCREALLQVLQHPSYSVQVYASAALRSFVLACPQQLLPSVTICMNSVNRELNLLAGPRKAQRRCVGFANGLSAVLSTSTLQPLYGSVDVNSRVLSQATTLLKSASSTSDLRISSTQVQVAWILIGGLMTLGPSFVKIHLTQLLLLWKNALPKPLNKDNMVQRDLLELSYLAHIRECALGSILTFLEFNSRILTVDVTKRLAAMFQNTTMFLNSLPSRKSTEDHSQRLSPALQLQDFDLMVRRRVLQCYAKLVNLSPLGGNEGLIQTNLLPFAVACFADPDAYTPSSLSTSLASSSATFESLWDLSDNCGFGVTGLVRGFDIAPLPTEQNQSTQHWASETGVEAAIDKTLLSPICQSLEHDSVRLYLGLATSDAPLPGPPSTEVVDAAIHLFAITLPLQSSKVQESILEQISSFVTSSSLQRDPARRAAITVNVTMGLLALLKVAVKETQSAPGDLRSSAVEKVIQELLHSFVVNPDRFTRNIASEALGRLCSSSGTTFTTSEVNYLIDQIVANREPHVRAGCAIALGSINAQLGGMAAGYHMKNILGILLSLASDPHPTVHFWALDSLSRVAESAGLGFSSFVSSTLGMLAQLYNSDTHNIEGQSLASSNLESDIPTQAAVVRCIDSVINVLGPDLQDMTKPRDLIMMLIGLFQQEDVHLVTLEAQRCAEHMSLYAPGLINFKEYVLSLQQTLGSGTSQARDMALDGLYNLMRRNVTEIFRTADPGLEDQLWTALNDNPEHEVLRSIMRNWLEQTALTETGAWVQRCQSILFKVVRKEAQPKVETSAKPTGVPDLQDEEVAGFAAAAGAPSADDAGAGPPAVQELLKWQVRTFAMECLRDLLTTVAKDAARNEESPAVLALQQKVADVVRIAFSASTGGVVQLRIQGLKIVDQILKIFGKIPDPDFPEVTLLEQYQAQIGSALTPAFAADSSPELAAEAVNVCASFIATGIVTDVDRMGRILKLLVSALESFSNESEVAAIGDLKNLSPNAQIMVKMAIFSAWAELQIASADQKYLVEVVKPHIVKLTPLWLASLREYARLRFEPDISTAAGSAALAGNLDTIYAALNRETLLKFYQQAWLNLVDAIASLIDEDLDFVFDALDGKTDTTNGPQTKATTEINYRDEPVAFFFVLFGLAFEALVGRSSDQRASQKQTLDILKALKKILRPAVSGQAIYQEVVFSETMDLLDRLVLTEGLAIQAVIIEIARNLCLGHPSARKSTSNGEENLSDDIDQLFELTRIIVLVITGLLPNLTENKAQARANLSDEAVELLGLALSALADAADVFPSIIKTDLHACILHIFTNILGTASCQAVVVPQSLPIFRRFLTSLSQVPTHQMPETKSQLRGTITSLLTILKQAQKRESEAALPCEKNTLLALTILLSATSRLLDASDPVLKQTVTLLADDLNGRLTSRVAANCTRTLLLLPKRSAVESAIAAHLLPHILSFLANPEKDVEGLDETRSLLASTLVSFVGTLPAAQVPSGMALVVPVLLARASREGEGMYKETAGKLLELAGVSQAGFRAVANGLGEEQREFLQNIVKLGASRGGERGGVQRQVSSSGGEPSIALKMNF